MYYLLGLCAGICQPTQMSVNSELHRKVGSNLFASLYSFASSTFILLLILLASGVSPWFSPSLLKSLPFWMWTGGLWGFYQMFVKIAIYPVLGSVQSMVFIIVAQIITGVLYDTFGVLGSDVRPLTTTRLIGACLVVTGTMLASMELNNKKNESLTANPADNPEKKTPAASFAKRQLCRLGGILIGFTSTTQGVVNGRLGAELHSMFRATYWSFITGDVIMITAFLISRFVISKKPLQVTGSPWWMWTGGAMGVLIIFSNAALNPRLGASLTVMIILTGSILGSILIDHFGLLHTKKHSISLVKICGLCFMICGITLIQFFAS